jgi:hypothetical protein
MGSRPALSGSRTNRAFAEGGQDLSLRSRRRLFTRKKSSPVRFLGALTRGFAGSFAAAVMTFGWPESLVPAPANSAAGGLLTHIPAMRLAASSAQHH